MRSTDKLLHALKEIFGYDSFRLNQRAAIEDAMAGYDSLVIMPTGGGKSICFQLPATQLQGLTLVISPLIALMKDQVESLRANGIMAASINSTVSPEEASEVYRLIRNKQLKLLYLSPETVLAPGIIDFLKEQEVSLIAVDEAHCVSIWGNDFRPEYTKLAALMDQFPKSARMALTATADKATQQDIAAQLSLRNAKTYLSSFERHNLSSSVLPGQDRWPQIKSFLRVRPAQAGIIYCQSRKSTEQLAQKLQKEGFKAAYYHAGVGNTERAGVQEAFIKDEIQIMCATIAFGMGIDKSNIRWVIHYNMPKNLESYYQEIGRAGRDGLPADTLLFYSYGDYQVLRGFIEDSTASEEFKEVQYQKLNRMMEYCQATSCRTNLVLSYFGEHREQDCGRCDRCRQPLQHFDGTVVAQKALSAQLRLHERANAAMLVDVLRGSARSDLLAQGFHNIKTYGAGKDLSRPEWIWHITQLINQGFLEIDFTQQSRLRVTEPGKQVLFQKRQVKLTQLQKSEERTGKAATKKTNKVLAEEGLLSALKALRKKLADEKNVPAYVIFSDKSLTEMASERPITLNDMRNISGVGSHKLNLYGGLFIDEILRYLNDQEKKLRGQTYAETLFLLKQGLSLQEIAEKRKLNPATVYSHLAYLLEKGEDISLRQHLSERDEAEVLAAWEGLNRPEGLKPIFEALNGKIGYGQIRLALTQHKIR